MYCNGGGGDRGVKKYSRGQTPYFFIPKGGSFEKKVLFIQTFYTTSVNSESGETTRSSFFSGVGGPWDRKITE